MKPPQGVGIAAFRIVGFVALVLALAACGTAGPGTEDGPEGGTPPADARWSVVPPATSGIDEVEGVSVSVAGDAITGTDSDPAGWSLEVARPGGFVELKTYSSVVFDDGSGTGDLTVTIEAPGGATCTVGPGTSSISAGGPNPGDSWAQLTYFGTDPDDGRPLISFSFVSAACDDLPGAAGSGEVEIWLFGFGSP
jgi:hypothetical protein